MLAGPEPPPCGRTQARARTRSAPRPTSLLLVLLALCALSTDAQAFQLGPRPTAVPGLIVKVEAPRAGSVGAAAATLHDALGAALAPKPAARAFAAGAAADSEEVAPPVVKAIDPSQNIYKVETPAGMTPQEAAAQLSEQPGVEYAIPDAYLHIAGGIPWEERPDAEDGASASLGGRKLAAHAAAKKAAAAAKKAAAAAKKAPKAPVKPKAPAKKKPVPKKPKKPVKPPLVKPPLIKRAPAPKAAPAKAAPPKKAAPKGPVVPNDSFYNMQWALPALRAPQAWALGGTDSSSVLQCVVDTGVMWNHPDLERNLELTDDAYRKKHTDDNGHGTHVAGIMGAVGGNKGGIAGASFKARLLPCKALDSSGWGLISTVVECIALCRNKGARVINTSFVLTEPHEALRDAIANGTTAGIFFAGAAGNAANDNDAWNFYPGGFDYPGNVAVANTAQDDSLSPTSNWGATKVQVAAPGTAILSTWPYRDYSAQFYAENTGTSMAAPYVSGAAALAMHVSGGALTNADVARLLVSTSRPAPPLAGKVLSGGVVNLEALVQAALAAKKQAAPTAG